MAKAKNHIFLLFGEDEYLLEENTKKLLDGFTETAIISASEAEESQIRNELCSLGFFTDSKAVIIEDLEKLDVNRGESITAFLENVPDKIRVIFKARSLEGTRKWVKSLKKQAEVIDCAPPKPYQITRMLAKEIAELKLDREETEYLTNALPLDLAGSHSELDKLSLYPDKLDLKTLKLLIEPALENQVFTLIDFLVKQDLKNSLITVKELMGSGNDPFAILGAIIWQLRVLYKVSDYRGNDPVRELNVKEYPYKKAKESLRRLSKAQIEEWFLLTLESDMSIKRGVLRADVALEVLVTKMCLSLPPNRVLKCENT
ncbi:MAG: DNA polymerase III subunit delta [Firmicutes bacterium]|nr:DNA polymerase III subunit delta [Bacillota bacterium]